ncbi:hypothetical protein DOY81_012861, partial [Sarcophaga bullata]
SILIKGTSREELTMKPVSLIAVMTLCTRPLLDGDFSRNIMAQFLIEILSVPALVYHLSTTAPQCIEQMSSMWILKRALGISEDAEWFTDYGKNMPGTKSLALLGNIINLFNIENLNEAKLLAYPAIER